MWHSTLDQIESNTGYIVNKQIAPVSRAGNSTFAFDSGNVLYSKLRPYLNKVIRPKEEGIATTELVPLRPNPEILNADYLTYYLRSTHFLSFAERCVAGAKMPRIIMSEFWQHRLPLPTPSEQLRIVKLLDQADALRKQRTESDIKTDRILPALFFKMFGDPVTNPKGWGKTPLRELLRDKDGALQSGPFGSNLHVSDFVDEGTILAVGIDNIHDSGFQVGRNRRVTREKYQELKKYKLEPNDVLITIMGSVGRTCVFPQWVGEAICTKHVYRIQTKQDQLDPEYLCAAFQFSPALRAQLGASITGQIVDAITSKDLRELLVDLPPLELQKRFAGIKQSLAHEKEQQKDSKLNLDRLFELIVHRAYLSDLTAKWREAHMKELLVEMEQQQRALAAAGHTLFGAQPS